MASAAPLKDIDEQFLQCCICMEQLKEPKLLPCLHRYCKDCLRKVFKEAKEIECPTCREKHTLPEGGIDGLKTDFNTKNIIEFIQLQSSVKVDPLRTCIHCRKRLEASAFCFKCNDFLCQGCHEFHASSLMVKDHHPHIFSLSEAGARNLTIQKLSSLKEAPRCHSHQGKLSELCCTTCGNLPICVPCTYGAHRGHHLEEVTSLAKIERERLEGKVAELMQYEEKIQMMQEQVKKAKEMLSKAVDEEKQVLEERLNAEEEYIKKEMLDTDEELKKQQAELEEKLKKKTSRRKQELEEEMREAKEKYERVCKEEREEADAEFKKLQEKNERENKQLQEGLDATNSSIKDLLASLKTQEDENTKKIEELSDHFNDIMKRFGTVTTTSSSILAAKHDWTDVQCIPDICRAIDPLIEELKGDHPELEALSGITIRGVPSLSRRRSKVDVNERGESVIDIEGMNDGWVVNGITSSKDGSIILTGGASGTQSHITVIKRTGERLRTDILESTISRPKRFCATLSQSKVASVCQKDKIGIYDIESGTYRKASVSGFSIGGSVTSVAVDPTNNNIIVGGRDNTQLYVFNDQLEYSHTLTLPNEIRYTWGITVHEGNLLVCDNVKGRAYAITMDGTGSKVVYEFTTPGTVGIDLRPKSVCTDRNGYIYMIWKENLTKGGIVAKYSPDGSQLVTTKSLDSKNYAECITAVDTEEGEKLVMPTLKTGKLIVYSL